jgi:hypothetical protein
MQFGMQAYPNQYGPRTPQEAQHGWQYQQDMSAMQPGAPLPNSYTRQQDMLTIFRGAQLANSYLRQDQLQQRRVQRDGRRTLWEPIVHVCKSCRQDKPLHTLKLCEECANARQKCCFDGCDTLCGKIFPACFHCNKTCPECNQKFTFVSECPTCVATIGKWLETPPHLMDGQPRDILQVEH